MIAGDTCPMNEQVGWCPGLLVESSLSTYLVCTECRTWVKKAQA